ncbi:MAG: proteasome assembly chaperone family protein [Candidatus Micrarchaeota archaeon]
MKETTIVEIEKIGKLKNPILLIGLPGIGLIGRVVGRYLVEELKAVKFAYMYSPHFPHQVFMTKTGGMRLINNRFYIIKSKVNDLVVLTGDIQAMTTNGQYEVATTVLQFVKKFGVKQVVAVGGYSNGKINAKRKIFGVATSKLLLEKFAKNGVVFGEAKGSIVGAAGLIPAMSKLNGMAGICIMGETHGGYIDVAAAKDIVTLLSKMFKFEIDTKKLEQRAKDSQKVLKRIEEEIQRNIVAPQLEQQTSYIR